MGTLGKVLVILNILAAGFFVYCVSLDYTARRTWATAALQAKIAEQGLPIEAPEGAAPGDSDNYLFPFEVSATDRIEVISKERLQKIIPNGGERYGGPPVANQTDEVKRVQVKVLEQINGQEGEEGKRSALLFYLLNLAQSGEERDGVNALLRDLFNPRRATDARRELHLLGRTPSQQNALDAIYNLSVLKDDIALRNTFLVDLARKSIASTIRSDIPNLVSLDLTSDQRDEQIRQLNNRFNELLNATNVANPNRNRIEQLRETIKGEAASDGIRSAADLAGNLLQDLSAVAEARQKLNELCLNRATVESEKKALNEIINLISEATVNPATVEEIGKSLLTRYFEEATLPTSKPGAKPVRDMSLKREQIAHLLYHLDQNDSNWQSRAQIIVGFSSYVKAVESQATQLTLMAQRSTNQIGEEYQRFIPEYQEVVQRALFLATKLNELGVIRDRQRTLTADHQSNVNKRIAEMEDLQKLLKELKETAKKSLVDFRTEQDRLFQITTTLQEAQDRLLGLEEQLRLLETKVAGK